MVDLLISLIKHLENLVKCSFVKPNEIKNFENEIKIIQN